MVEELSKLLYGLARKVVQMTGDSMIRVEQVPYLKTEIDDFESRTVELALNPAVCAECRARE